jgi:3-oxoacyl-[acyl-carrier-protein] synthase III
MNKKPVKITGTGTFLPGEPIGIEDVDQVLGELSVAPKKIQKWLGRMKTVLKEMLEVEKYHFAIDPVSKEFTEDNITMSVKAAEKAIKMAGIKNSDIDFIAYGSAHQDQMPTASVRIQEQLGIGSCGEMSIHANCTSAYKALLTAYEFIQSGRYKNALVVASSMSSSELRASYYNQELVSKEEVFLRYFLSDGAGAVVLQASQEQKRGFFLENVYIESVGGKKPSAMFNKRPAYWINPKTEFEEGRHHLAQMMNEQIRSHFMEEEGSVFTNGLKRMLIKYPVALENLKFLQVNFPSKHIADLVADECAEIGIPRDKFYTKISSMGYIGPPMAFVCLDNIIREEKTNNNDLIISFVTEVSKFMQAGFCVQYFE